VQLKQVIVADGFLFGVLFSRSVTLRIKKHRYLQKTTISLPRLNRHVENREFPSSGGDGQSVDALTDKIHPFLRLS